MIYKVVEVIWNFLTGGWTGIKGTLRGPRGPKKTKIEEEKKIEKIKETLILNNFVAIFFCCSQLTTDTKRRKDKETKRRNDKKTKN